MGSRDAQTRPEAEPTTMDDAVVAPRRSRRRLLWTCAALVASPLLCELGLRALLFVEWEPVRRVGLRFRDAGFYTSRESDDDHWKLRWLFTPEELRTAPPRYDADVGWIDGRVDPETYRHIDDEPADPRRPVLLFGASFAGCVTGRDTCFQGLLERSALGDELVLHNYGIGGYGLDQMALLFQRVIRLYDGRDPIVVFAPVVDSDLDRCMVSLRGWPKPRFVLEDERLRLEGEVPMSTEEYLREHPVGIGSYLWRHLVFRTEFLPEAVRAPWVRRVERRDEQRMLVSALIRQLQGELDRRELDWFFLLFHGRGALDANPETDPAGWQERHLRGLLDRKGARWVSTRPALRAACEASGRGIEECYILEGQGSNHLTVAGNEAAFQSLVEGLAGL